MIDVVAERFTHLELTFADSQSPDEHCLTLNRGNGSGIHIAVLHVNKVSEGEAVKIGEAVSVLYGLPLYPRRRNTAWLPPVTVPSTIPLH